MQRLGVLAGVGVVVCLLAGRAALGQSEQWWADYNEQHGEECEAGPIFGDGPDLCDGPMWRWHWALWARAFYLDSDKDCHRYYDEEFEEWTYQDVEELEFTGDWKIQRLEDGLWTDLTAISGNHWLASWATTVMYEPNRWYRAKCGLNDTSGDGPYGDDPVAISYSPSYVLYPPYPVNVRVAPTYPRYNEDSEGSPWPGGVTFKYFWSASCGPEDDPTHLPHLNLVTLRENVHYDASDNPHQLSHPTGGPPPQPSNCFTSQAPNPRLSPPGSGNGPDGGFFDEHEMPTMTTSKWESYCQAGQEYEWSTGWPQAPPYDQATGWETLEGQEYTIARHVEKYQGGTLWRYRLTKGAYTHTYDLGPVQ